MTSPADFAQRFSSRLNVLLSNQGVALSYHARCKALGGLLGGDEGLGHYLLEGTTLPDWALFSQICSKFQVQPGYFLDEDPGLSSTDVEFVRGVTGGDTIVWKPPRGKDSMEGHRKLAWMSGANCRPNLRATDVVVFNSGEDATLLSHSHYVMQIHGSWHAKACTQHDRKAVFIDDNNTPLILPLDSMGLVDLDARAKHGISSINPIVGALRSAVDFV